jgi:hypothetical protein
LTVVLPQDAYLRHYADPSLIGVRRPIAVHRWSLVYLHLFVECTGVC